MLALIVSPHNVLVTAGDRTVLARGARYLELATKLLQRTRLTSATGGIWEAADVQWWSRRERATDGRGQLFWLDKHGEPVAAIVATEFGSSTQFDVLGAPASDEGGSSAWELVLDGAEELSQTSDAPVGRREIARSEAAWQHVGSGNSAASIPEILAG